MATISTIFRKVPLVTLLITLLTFTTTAKSRVDLTVAMGNPVLEEGKTQVTELKVGLTGFALQSVDRAPINLSLVLDKSGSMGGDKIAKAREAALLVVDILGENDIFSLIAYSSGVETLIPATKLTNKEEVRRKIRSIGASGSTALFGGVSKGIAEVNKFLDMERVNRIILLSDGLANVGPSSPYELGRLGQSAGKKGIAVTTIGLGLGYNEDLMTQLALNSDGNHAFVENSQDLVTIFNKELGDVLSVVAQDVTITIECDDNIRPIRVIDRDADIRGQKVSLNLNQLYSKQEKYIILEVEVPKGKKGKTTQIANVKVSYNNMKTNRTDNLKGTTKVAFTDSKKEVIAKQDKKVKVQAIKSKANVRSKKAVALRDKGDILGAQEMIQMNVESYSAGASAFDSEELKEESREAKKEVEQVKDEKSWNRNRKSMRKKQYKKQKQTSY